MIGFQCSPSTAQSTSQVTPNSIRSSDIDGNSNQLMSHARQSSADTAATATSDQHQMASLKSSTVISANKSSSNVLSSLTSHINLINQSKLSSSSGASNEAKTTQSSPMTTTPATTVVAMQATSAGSPGYHSAASSPSSSVAASPISAHSSTGGGAPATPSSSSSSSSSGIHSTASPLSSSSSSSSSPSSCVSSNQTHPPTAAAATSGNQASNNQGAHHHHHHASSLSPTSSASSTSSQASSRGPILPTLLDHYPEINQDGLGLTWFHDANNRNKLSAALMSNKMIISGDISLAEMSRYPVPIMARPPLGVSDITLENWLQELVHSPQPQRGIKLTFTSTRTVEPAFRVLARYAEHLKGPVILSADILARPAPASMAPQGRPSNGRQQQQQQSSQQQQPVDAWTFLMLCRTRFPKSIISIGWCSLVGAGSGPVNLGQLAASTNQWAPPMVVDPISCGMPDSSSSLHSSADSMFELDIMDTQPSLNKLASAAANGAPNGSHLGHLQHLSHQHRLHQHLHPYPLVHHNAPQHNRHLQLSHQQLTHQLNSHSHLIQLNHLSHHHMNNNHHHLTGLTHHILSSTGSLNSSSGNSSGSPSPTSPISHLMSPHQAVATNLSLAAAGGQAKSSLQHHHQANSVDSTEQLFLAAAAASAAEQQQAGQVTSKGSGGPSGQAASSAAAAAAAMAAAVMAATSTFNHGHNHQSQNQASQQQQQQQQQHQQLPLNLNINEADQRLTAASCNPAATSTLSHLAQKIQSYQQNHNLTNNQQAPSQQHLDQAMHHHSSLSAKLFASHQLASGTHIQKKTAIQAGSSNAPSPQSSSPKHEHQAPSGTSNLLLKTTSNNHLQQQGACYTRDMIDKMASLVKEYNLTQPVTFPVEARMLKNSLAELQRLLYQVGSNSTLTVVAQQEDLISVDDLLIIRKAFSTNQILFDLPDELAASLKHELELM